MDLEKQLAAVEKELQEYKGLIDMIADDLLTENNMMEMGCSRDEDLALNQYNFLFKGRYYFGSTPLAAIQAARKSMESKVE